MFLFCKGSGDPTPFSKAVPSSDSGTARLSQCTGSGISCESTEAHLQNWNWSHLAIFVSNRKCLVDFSKLIWYCTPLVCAQVSIYFDLLLVSSVIDIFDFTSCVVRCIGVSVYTMLKSQRTLEINRTNAELVTDLLLFEWLKRMKMMMATVRYARENNTKNGIKFI